MICSASFSAGSIARNSLSLRTFMPNSSHLCSFSGPGLLPARRKLVFELTDEEFLPPFLLIISFISSLLTLKFPEITMVIPLSASDTAACLRPISKFSPNSLSLFISRRLASLCVKSYTLFAITSPTSFTAAICSMSAAITLSMFSKCPAISPAVCSPTYLIPSAKSTLSKGT